MDKIIVTTGGTGGHIFPAISVVEELRSRYPQIKVLFIGGEYGQEKKLAENAGINFVSLPVRGFLGRGLKAVPAFFDLMISIIKARRLIKYFSPDVIAGFGGYASFPPMLAGLVSGIPCLLHEQNAIAGTSNKILAKLGAKVCVTLPDTIGFKGNVTVSGNPVRSVFASLAKERKDRQTKHLLVLGGSQGAHALNEYMIKSLPFFKIQKVEIMHQCGKKDETAVKKAYQANGYSSGCVSSFIEDMQNAYAWADLIFCRAGASTIAELCMAGLPAILVPFPAAIHDHQTSNARILADAGAAIMIRQDNLEKENAANTICELLNNYEKRKIMSDKMISLAKPEATAIIADCLENIQKKSNES